ncbi:MAG: TetR/AcrR family transcriptional regulator [Sporomusaceae bacterium]|nr:TetR/AcrR family transcriptional regulator [Sporomusaceae bacterium]
MSTMTNRAKQAATTKAKIFDCGVKLIRKYGFDKVTVEQIAADAGVSVGTYYYYFPSKFELFSEIFKKADEYFENHVESQLEAEKPLDQIVEFFDRYADFTLLNGLDMVKKLYTADNKMFITKGRAMQNILCAIIVAGQQSQQISPNLSPQEITNILFIAGRGVVYEWCLHDGATDLKQDMKRVMQIMVNGLRYQA